MHILQKAFFKHTLRKISRISRKKYKKTKLVVDKFTKKIYDIAICSLVYIFAEIKDKGYNIKDTKGTNNKLIIILNKFT